MINRYFEFFKNIYLKKYINIKKYLIKRGPKIEFNIIE